LYQYLWKNDTRQLRIEVSKLIGEVGWHTVSDYLANALTKVFGEKWFATNRTILTLFEAEELVGVDSDLLKIFKTAPNTHSFETVRTEFLKQLYSIIRKQMCDGGYAFFFDSQKMRNRSSCVLLTEIENVRRKEYAVAIQMFRDSDARCSHSRDAFNPIWHTEYGFRILRTLRLDFPSFLDAWDNIVSAIEKTTETLEIISQDYSTDVPNINWPIDRCASYRMKDLVSHLVIIFAQPDTVNPAIHNHLFETGFLNPTEVVRTVLDGLTKHPKSKKMYLLNKAEINELGAVNDIRILEDLYFPAAHHFVESTNLEALDLLLRVLNTEFETFIDNRFYQLHEDVLRKVLDIQDDRIGQAAAEYIAGIEVDDYDLHIIGATDEAFDLATELVVKYKRSEAAEYYWRFEKESEGPKLSGEIADVIIKLQGASATDRLLEGVWWYDKSAPYQVGIHEGVVDAVLSLGEEGYNSLRLFIEKEKVIDAARRLIDTIREKTGRNILPADHDIIEEIRFLDSESTR